MKKVTSWVRSNAAFIFLTIISIYFVFSSTVNVGLQKLNTKELILFICTTLIFGVIITSLVGDTGYEAGKKDDSYIQTRQEAIDYAEKCLPYREEAELYVNREIDKGIVQDRTTALATSGLKYVEVFDENGVYIMSKPTFKELKYRQKKTVIRARLIKKQDFTLFGFAAGKVVGRKPTPNEVDRRKRQAVTLTITRVFMAIVMGSIMFSFIGISFASILYSIYQLLIWIGSGMLTRQKNYNFIVIECREYDQDRIWWLKTFMALSDEDKAELSKEVNKKAIGELPKLEEKVEEQPKEVEEEHTIDTIEK